MELAEEIKRLAALLEAQQSTKMKDFDISDWDPENQHRNRLLTMDRVGRF